MALARTNSPTLALAKPHKGGQRALYLHPARFHVVACGRRWGKTEFGKLVAVQALFKHCVDVWWVAPTYKMSSAIWRDFRSTLGRFAVSANAQERFLEFNTGATLTIWTGAQADTMRGGAPGLVVVDEAAMIKDGGDMWNAVIRPALTDKRGRALFLSTPRGHNWFWELYNRGLDPLFPQYKSWNFPTAYNPLLPAGEIDEARLTLPERLFRQEYMAEFIEDAGGVFRGVLAASTLDIAAPYAGDFVFGVDWGRENDFTVICVMDRETLRQVDMDRFNKIGWELQRGRLRALADKWQPRVIWAEENSIGSVNIEALQAEGLPVRGFVTTASSKPPLIEALALAIERQDAVLLNDRVQTAELQAYAFDRLPGGGFRYSAPSGAHDDTVIALALAYHGARSSGSLILFGDD